MASRKEETKRNNEIRKMKGIKRTGGKIKMIQRNKEGSTETRHNENSQIFPFSCFRNGVLVLSVLCNKNKNH
jgi:hypothetical protein